MNVEFVAGAEIVEHLVKDSLVFVAMDGPELILELLRKLEKADIVVKIEYFVIWHNQPKKSAQRLHQV